jgi:hypothetical protein
VQPESHGHAQSASAIANQSAQKQSLKPLRAPLALHPQGHGQINFVPKPQQGLGVGRKQVTGKLELSPTTAENVTHAGPRCEIIELEEGPLVQAYYAPTTKLVQQFPTDIQTVARHLADQLEHAPLRGQA